MQLHFIKLINNHAHMFGILFFRQLGISLEHRELTLVLAHWQLKFALYNMKRILNYEKCYFSRTHVFTFNFSLC